MDRRQLLASAALAAGAAWREVRVEAADGVKREEQDGRIDLTHQGRLVARYLQTPVAGPAGTGPLFTRGGYLHPLHAPNGLVVTDDFPEDHRHQRGVFFAWTKTEVGDQHPDFWNLGSGTGRVRSITAEPFARPAGAGFRATHLWEMHRGDAWEPVLDESWEVLFHPPAFTDLKAPDAAYVLDFTSRQTPRVAVQLPVYRYGGMCVRGAAAWNRKGSPMRVLTSEGKDWTTAENTRARWADMSGPLPGGVAGIALLEHPGNLRAPNLLRVPPEYPYVVYCPSKGEALTLEAGKTYTFRYRLVAHNGLADAARLNRLWDEFTRG
jgi:hypothetical protein